jgi:hypothetical protein
MPEMTVETEKRNQGVYRVGQRFDNASINFISHRDPTTAYLVDGIVRDAVGKGFVVLDPKTKEPISWNDKFQLENDKYYETLLQGATITRSYGQSVLTFMNKEKEGEFLLRAYRPRDFQLKFNEETDLVKVETWLSIVGVARMNKKTFQTEEEIEDTFWYVWRHKPIHGQVMSYIEPIFDNLWGLYTIDANSIYYVVRVGGGLKIVKVPLQLLANEEWRSEFESGMENLNSPNSLILVPLMDGVETQVEFNVDTGGPAIDFTKIRDVHLDRISSYSGVPRNKFIGAELGLRSAEQNTLNFWDVLQGIQKHMTPLIKWYVNKIAKATGLITEDAEFEISFNVRHELSQEAKTDLLTKQLKNVKELVGMKSALGITNKQIVELTEVDLEVQEVEEIEPEMEVEDNVGQDQEQTEEEDRDE